MGGVAFAGFVCDEDCQHIAVSLPSASVVALSKIGITIGRGTPDSAVVYHAREHGRVLVTGNKSDFAREMKEAADRCTPAKCFEGGGMITVPSGVREIQFSKISRSLELNGVSVNWNDVFLCNLWIDLLRDGSYRIKRLPLCPIFKRDHVAECGRCQELGFEGIA